MKLISNYLSERLLKITQRSPISLHFLKVSLSFNITILETKLLPLGLLEGT